MTKLDKETKFINEGNQIVANIVNKGNQTIANITFMDSGKITVVLPPREDIAKYKDRYVICAMDSDNVTDILQIVDD